MSSKLEWCLLNLEFIIIYVFYCTYCIGTVIDDFKCCNSINGNENMTRPKIQASNFDLYIFNSGLLKGNLAKKHHLNGIIIKLSSPGFVTLSRWIKLVLGISLLYCQLFQKRKNTAVGKVCYLVVPFFFFFFFLQWNTVFLS